MQIDFGIESDPNKNDQDDRSETVGSQSDDKSHERGEQEKEAESSEYLDMEKTVVPVQ